MAKIDENHNKRVVGFLLEHPAAADAIHGLGQEFDKQIAMHLCDGSEREPLRSGDLVVRHLEVNNPIAVVKPNGKIWRLDD